MSLSRLMLAVLLVIALPANTQAQSLRGRVLDAASRQPVAGAVVLALDSTGAPVARSLSDGTGAFRVATTAAVKRLRALHIGFRPAEVGVGANAVSDVELRMDRLPTLLTPVRVTDSGRCPADRSRAAAFALWDQVRTSLLASVVAQASDSAIVRRAQYHRWYARTNREIERQEVRRDSTAVDRSFVAVEAPASLVNAGFVRERDDARMYLAPDAEVLTDDAFLTANCFHLVRDAAHSGQLGVAFEPIDGRTDRTPIVGAAWVDTSARSLASIEYRYRTNGAPLAVPPGGTVSFRTFANGRVMVERFSIHMAHPVAAPAGTSEGFWSKLEATPLDVQEGGGELLQVTWPGGESWRAKLGRVRGQVVQDGQPAAGLAVRLTGTDYAAVADSNGAFSIGDLVPGPYRVSVTEPDLALLGMTLQTNVRFTAARDSTTTISVIAPTMRDVAVAACGKGARDEGFLVGKVLRPDGDWAAHAKLIVTTVNASGAERVFDSRVESKGAPRDRLAEATTDDGGLFFVCHLPRDGTVEMHAELEGVGSGGVSASLGRGIAPVLIRLR